jgi:glycosyltransferase involved in cell wall biosynthesis
MAWGVLRPWLEALRDEDFEVHIACANGPYISRLRESGFEVHLVDMRRTFAPWMHLLPLFRLWRLMRAGRFDMINTHGPIGGLLGRLAARMAGCRNVVAMIHGFYFHENMRRASRWPYIALEWVLGRCTDHFLFVSDEDHASARRLRIMSAGAKSLTLYNGVDTEHFVPREVLPRRGAGIRRRLEIGPSRVVVGIVARIVREKGFREFLEMAAMTVAAGSDAIFLVVGETLATDRDQYGEIFRREVRERGLDSHFRFAGETEEVASYLNAMDVFVLPSYREGFPVSILEAMSSGLPVVATNIRGCRESVVEGETGLLAPVRDSAALAERVGSLIRDEGRARGMGAAGRSRVVACFERRAVQRRFVCFVRSVLGDR